MGTGMNDRSVVARNLGSMYGMLLFFKASLIGFDETDESTSRVRQLFLDEAETLRAARSGISASVESLKALLGRLEGEELLSFVAGMALTARAVDEESRARDMI